jgi:hypothetical protein
VDPSAVEMVGAHGEPASVGDADAGRTGDDVAANENRDDVEATDENRDDVEATDETATA